MISGNKHRRKLKRDLSKLKRKETQLKLSVIYIDNKRNQRIMQFGPDSEDVQGLNYSIAREKGRLAAVRASIREVEASLDEFSKKPARKLRLVKERL